MPKQCRSIYASHIEQHINMKRKLGFKFRTATIILSSFDQLSIKIGVTSKGITRELAEKWCKRRLNESSIYWYTRIQIVAQFSTFLRDLGIESFVFKLPPFPRSTFTPYIYSQKEIKDIFKAADSLVVHKRIMNSSIFSIPVILRLLYATGIRIGETLNLKEDDINIEERYIQIKDSKSGKQRIIPISASLAKVLRQYQIQKGKLPIANKSKYFFVRVDGKKCNWITIGKWFKDCLVKADIRCERRNQFPRIHDLRHTFAVTSLANMADAGIDLYASLPILSTYLGHQSLESTNHYVRLTANMYPGLIKDMDVMCLDVFPKLKNYEAN